MTNQPPPELTPERPVHSDFTLPRTYRIRRAITCAVLALLVGGIGLGTYVWNKAPAEIPIIKAEGPLKVKPEQPGGIDIPNQDVLAYQQIDNSGSNTPPVEHLLPPPETPQAAPPSVAANIPAPPAPKVETLLAPPPPPPVVTTVMPEKPKPQSQAGLAPAPEAAPRSAVVAVNADSTAAPSAAEMEAAPQAENPAPVANDDRPASAPAKPGRKGFRIQLASFPDIDTARSQMAHMEKRYASQLGEAKLHLAKADLGPRGIYYRVQSNPITDTEARDICGALTKIKAGCIVVKP